MSETQELETAAQKLALDILKKSLEANGAETSGKKEEIVHRLGNKVLEIGVDGFLDGLDKERLKEVCNGIKFKEGSSRKKESPKSKLYKHILEKGLEYFLQDCTKEQLNDFCSILLLEQSTNDAMVSQIADEVMLTGTKKFLHNLPVPLLKKWCAQLGLKPATSAKTKQLVEQLMVHIFELEPLDEEQEEEESKRDTETSQSKEKEKEKEREGGKKEQGGKREKYVPPPISTIKKGMTKEHLHNTFNATDLKEFCKQNNLPSSGKKPLLIKRIIKFLDTGEIEVPKARRGKRKRGADKTSAAKRAKADKGEEGEKQQEEDEEEEEEEEAEAEAEESEVNSDGGTEKTAGDNRENSESQTQMEGDEVPLLKEVSNGEMGYSTNGTTEMSETDNNNSTALTQPSSVDNNAVSGVVESVGS